MALYDPNEFPEVETTTDFTLADVLAWARTKPATERYPYMDCFECVICQFLRDTGRAEEPVVEMNGEWSDATRPNGPFCASPRAVNIAAQNNMERDSWTFGAFADRLEKAL